MTLEKHTALYSPLDIEYAQVMSGHYEDLSFRSDECTVIAGLKDNRITGFWRPMVMFGKDGLQKEQIRRLYDICPNIYYQDFLIDGKLSLASKFLLEKGYKATPYYTQIIDLTKTEEELHADVRKSYKSLINKPVIISRLGNVEPLRKLHIQVHDRETRSKESWFLQQRMIWAKQVFVLLQSKFLNMRNPHSAISQAGGMFYYNPHICYYGVGCSMEGVGSHALIWQAILYAKELGCSKFEMGEQVFTNDKLADISKFKRGFGGQCVVRLNLEKE